MDCKIVSWEIFYRLSRRLAALVRESGFQPDLIAAVDRGGHLPARILSDHLGIYNMVGFKIEHYHGARKEKKATIRYPLPDGIRAERVLLVDDVADSGDTFSLARSHVETKVSPATLKTAVLHYKTVSEYQPDYFAARVENWHWLIYPWAVIEDLSSFIQQMQPPPENQEEVIVRLQKEYGLEISGETAGDVLASLAGQNRRDG